LPSRKHSINTEVRNRFSQLPDNEGYKQTISNSGTADTDDDVNLLASVETNLSRRSKRFANKGNTGVVENVSEAVGKMGRYTCDDCGSAFKNSRGLSIHKAKCHSDKVRADITIVDLETDSDVGSTQSEAASVNKGNFIRADVSDTVSSCQTADADDDVKSLTSVETNCSRKSKRLANKRNVGAAENVSKAGERNNASRTESLTKTVKNDCRYRCDDCGFVCKNSQGLLLHRRNRHTAKGRATDVTSVHLQAHDEVKTQSDAVCMNKRNASRTDSLTETITIGCYTCEDCGSVFEKSKGLSLHRRRRHAAKVPAGDVMSVHLQAHDQVKTQSETVCMNKCNVRHTESITQTVNKEGHYTCDDCGLVCKNSRGLLLHRRRRHATKVEGDDSLTVEIGLDDDVKNTQSEAVSISQSNASQAEIVQKDVNYTCDVCGSVFEKSRGLLVHKGKLHAAKVRADDATSIDVEPDDDVISIQSGAVSMSTLESISSGVRKSARLLNKNKTLNATKLKPQVSVNNELDMTSLTSDDPNFGSSSKSWHRYKEMNTKKCHSKSTFAEQISKLEKQYLPRQKVTPQTDPLYDKLKAYHDSLLRSVSNTTTEKLSTEVLDVIVNPTVIDDADRRFLWSKDDENRLNELNEDAN